MTGFTIKCNNCGNEVDIQTEQKRFNGKVFITIHSNTACGLICHKCDEKVMLDDNY